MCFVSEVNYEADNKLWYYRFYGKKQSKQFKTGIYNLYVEHKNGSSFQGWFIVDNGSFSSEVPLIYKPSNDEILTKDRPVIRFNDFRSSNYLPHEKRIFYVQLVNIEQDKKEIWSYFEFAPLRTSIQIEKVLRAGRYYIYLMYQERYNLSGLRISRGSYIKRYFSVK